MDKLSEIAILLLAEENVRKHNGYEVQFTNTDFALRSYFSDLVEKLGFEVKRKSEKQLVVYSKQLAEALFNLSPSYRSKPRKSGKQNACSPNCGCSIADGMLYDGVEYAPSSFPPAAFQEPALALKLFFSCEGGVVLSEKGGNEVIVRVCHPVLKAQIKQMLSLLEFDFRERGKGLIYLRKKSEVKKFAEQVGFVDGVVAARGNNKGVEKTVLLNSLIQ